MTTLQRADQFGKLIESVRHLYDMDVEHDGIIDLLADAMHWCDANGDDFHIALATAGKHYLAELRGDLSDRRPVSLAPVYRELNIDAVLRLRRQVAILWEIDDVREMRPELSDDQAWDVLQSIVKHHDAGIGINWEVIEAAAESLFGPEPDEARSGSTEGQP
jgi:hypothetical protein